MSTGRIIGIIAFGILIIAALIGVMILTSVFGRDSGAIPLPAESPALERPEITEPDALNRVEVVRDTVQAVISTLSRPDTYSRDVTVEMFWEDGHVEYNISVWVTGGMTSMRSLSSSGIEKRVIITPERYYIWYFGDMTPFIGDFSSLEDAGRLSDELQMIVTYEDILGLEERNIVEAGFDLWGDEHCVYAVYYSRLLRYSKRYYVSIESGLVVGATEHDQSGELVYRMTAGAPNYNNIDPAVFTLPDGSNVAEL